MVCQELMKNGDPHGFAKAGKMAFAITDVYARSLSPRRNTFDLNCVVV